MKNPVKQKEDFWNTINGDKVNLNILKDEDVFIVEEDGISIIVIHVPRADYKMRPVYVGGNPYKGTYKRNNEGDYHMAEYEVDAMIRDKNPDGNDSKILVYYTMEDIDPTTLKQYRQQFQVHNPEHVWNTLEDKEFLESLGGYRKDRATGAEGLTLAGLMMFGKGLAIRDEFDNIFMDYRDESQKTSEIRWNDRVTYDGTWENNLYNFFTKVTRKLTADLPKSFVLENNERIDDTPVHKAIREAFVNLIIHSDYLVDAGTLKVIKTAEGYEFTNPGILKLPVDEIFRGGNSKPRNPHMQTMLRMVGYGDNAGSGFPTILYAWNMEGWIEPDLHEDTKLNQVVLTLKMVPKWKGYLEQLSNLIPENIFISDENLQVFKEAFNPDKLDIPSIANMESVAKALSDRLGNISGLNMSGMEKGLIEIRNNLAHMNVRTEGLAEFSKILAEALADTTKRTAEKSAESAEKSAEKITDSTIKLSKRQEQILSVMDVDSEYSADEIATLVGLKGPRTRQLLNVLVSLGKIKTVGVTKGRRYMKV